MDFRNITGKLKGLFRDDNIAETQHEGVDDSYRSLSDKELTKILNNIHVTDMQRQPIDKTYIPGMLEPMGTELMSRRVDYAKLMELAPETKNASAILVSSILAPNDFAKTGFKTTLELEDLDGESTTKITELINSHFGDKLGLSTLISDWLEDALFKVGSKVVMVFPTNSIERLRESVSVSNDTNAQGSIEALVSNFSTGFEDEIHGSLESFGVERTKDIINDIKKDEEVVDKVMSALEGIVDSSEGTTKAIKKVRQKVSSNLASGLEELRKRHNFTFSNDPRMLFSGRLRNASAMEAMDKKVLDKLGDNPTSQFLARDDGLSNQADQSVTQYQHTPYLDLSEFIHDDKPSEFPAMIELPSESVIPIIVDGSPSTHLGYFVLLNEQGNPISVDTDDPAQMEQSHAGNQRIDNLYNAFYGQTQFSTSRQLTNNTKAEVMGAIYDSYIKHMLSSKLKDFGFSGYQISLNNDISRVMLYRVLKNSETRVLFVPKKLVHYLAFEFHNDGTGRSKLDAIKFPLSLKITLIITRLISLMESSINRRKLNITLDDTVGNPLEVLQSVKKELTKNKMYGLTYDPTTIVKGILDKELTIVPNRIPGVEDFQLDTEENSVNYPTPDDGVLDEINNMYMMSLGVPPSALNRLSEDEFSRSVASNNIFFSNQLKESQLVVCEFMTEFVRNYIRYSSKLKKGIQSVLTNQGSDDNTREGGENSKVALKVENVIENLEYTLPSPALAHDKSSFEEVRDYVEIIESVVSAILPGELSDDNDMGDTIAVLRSHLKHSLLIDHISSNSILSDLNFDVMNNMPVEDILGRLQKLSGLKASLTEQKEVLSGEGGEGGDDKGGSAW